MDRAQNCVDTGTGGCVIAENDLSGAESVPYGCGASGICLADGNVHTVTVTYTTQPSALQTNCSDSAGCLDVILDGTDLFPQGVSFNMTSIGLTNNTAYVGFTGATGGSVENNNILSWVFSRKISATSTYARWDRPHRRHAQLRSRLP